MVKMIRKEDGCRYCRPDKACLVCIQQTSYLDVLRNELARRESAKPATAA